METHLKLQKGRGFAHHPVGNVYTVAGYEGRLNPLTYKH